MGQGNFMISHVISRRVAADGHRSPDLLHGLLMLCEGKETPRSLSKVVGMGELDVADMLDRARVGGFSRVPASMGAEREVRPPALDGLFPTAWKRTLVELMLKADGTHTAEVDAALQAVGKFTDPGAAVRDLRADLKVVGVAVTSSKIDSVMAFRYRIIGNDAWRMQKIIANGWAL